MVPVLKGDGTAEVVAGTTVADVAKGEGGGFRVVGKDGFKVGFETFEISEATVVFGFHRSSSMAMVPMRISRNRRMRMWNAAIMLWDTGGSDHDLGSRAKQHDPLMFPLPCLGADKYFVELRSSVE